jgi:hypothetical protein
MDSANWLLCGDPKFGTRPIQTAAMRILGNVVSQEMLKNGGRPVKASSKNRPAKPKRSAPASKSKSSGNSIDTLVNKQLSSLKQADTLFKDAVSIIDLPQKTPGTRPVYSCDCIYSAPV